MTMTSELDLDALEMRIRRAQHSTNPVDHHDAALAILNDTRALISAARERDTLRARVAELERQTSEARDARIAEVEAMRERAAKIARARGQEDVAARIAALTSKP